MKYKIFGCKVNKYYADEWMNSSYLQGKKGIFIASCVVTDKAKRKWIKFVKQELQKIPENEKIYISGCGAFEKGKENKAFFDVYQELKGYEKQIEILGESPKENNLIGKKTQIPSSLFTKKFLIIQGGCDSYCTFCLTVIKRGKHFYRKKEEIVQEINDFEARGGKEVVLTGVNLCAWGLENTNYYAHSQFHMLLDYILKNTSLPRIRISSLGPEFIGDKVLQIFSNKRIMPYFHYSIQSGNSQILKQMKRHYDGNYIRELLKKTYQIPRETPGEINIGADLIVGFPGETEEQFFDTLDLVQNFHITKIHAFPFSSHKLGEQVPASFFGNQVDEKVKKKRLEQLILAGEKTRKIFIESQIGNIHEVLIETVKEKSFTGWSKNYIECHEKNFHILSGTLKKNEIVIGKIVSE